MTYRICYEVHGNPKSRGGRIVIHPENTTGAILDEGMEATNGGWWQGEVDEMVYIPPRELAELGGANDLLEFYDDPTHPFLDGLFDKNLRRSALMEPGGVVVGRDFTLDAMLGSDKRFFMSDIVSRASGV